MREQQKTTATLDSRIARNLKTEESNKSEGRLQDLMKKFGHKEKSKH